MKFTIAATLIAAYLSGSADAIRLTAFTTEADVVEQVKSTADDSSAFTFVDEKGLKPDNEDEDSENKDVAPVEEKSEDKKSKGGKKGKKPEDGEKPEKTEDEDSENKDVAPVEEKS
jgi:hypothetical protein